MSVVVLDTNIVSYLFKRDTRADLYAPHLQGQELAISVITVAELFQWAEMRKWRCASGVKHALLSSSGISTGTRFYQWIFQHAANGPLCGRTAARKAHRSHLKTPGWLLQPFGMTCR